MTVSRGIILNRAQPRLKSGRTYEERLEYYSMPEPNSGCRLWLACVHKNGYGLFYFDGRHGTAHVAAWETHNRRKVPKGMQVCHKCDVRSCIEPTHLWLGTPAQNTADMVSKGRVRFRPSKGVANGGAKLRESDIPKIRTDSRSSVELALAYGVSRGIIRKIITRALWKHVP